VDGISETGGDFVHEKTAERQADTGFGLPFRRVGDTKIDSILYTTTVLLQHTSHRRKRNLIAMGGILKLSQPDAYNI